MGNCMAMAHRQVSPEFELQVLPGALQSDGANAEAAGAYDIHSATMEEKWNHR
ncbi:transposase-like protein [Salinibacter ruber]|nr:transposase-like protein [Salinibacter ruber]